MLEKLRDINSASNLSGQITELLETLDALTVSDNLRMVVERIPLAIRGKIKQDAEPKLIANTFSRLFEEYDQYRYDLLKAINYIEANSKSYRNLENYIIQLNKETWICDLVKYLSELGGSEQIESWYRSSLSNVAAMHQQTPSLKEMICDLFNYPLKIEPDLDIPPLLQFIWRATEAATKDLISVQTIQALQKLVKTIFGQEQCLQKLHDSFIAHIEGEHEAHFCLSILIQDFTQESKPRYRLDIYNWHSEGGRPKLVDSAPTNKDYPSGINYFSSVDEIKNYVTNWLSEANFPADRAIEFFLPKRLLYLDVDEWCINDPFLESEIALGTEYQVTIRSTDRLKHYGRFGSRLENRWQQFRMEPKIYRISQVIRSAEALRDQLKVCEESCLVVEYPITESNFVVLHGMLPAGIPVAFWVRDLLRELNTLNTKNLIEELEHTLKNHKEQLPEKLLEMRKRPREEKDSIGVSLFWEDPARLIEVPQAVPLNSK